MSDERDSCRYCGERFFVVNLGNHEADCAKKTKSQRDVAGDAGLPFDVCPYCMYTVPKGGTCTCIESMAKRTEAYMAQQAVVDDLGVDEFARAMKLKLALSRAKGKAGWQDPSRCTELFLGMELIRHLAKGNRGTFEDIANFAMMLHQRDADPAVLQEAFVRVMRGE